MTKFDPWQEARDKLVRRYEDGDTTIAPYLVERIREWKQKRLLDAAHTFVMAADGDE
ncbi:hypothetical protein [Nocardioides albus]|uniref:Uncharacterized protein n=1 Tax=Nocardioides albus TaxID=1841 RepID=A0A7W5F7V2_9ACTN|nr:hypothetical protein [Nocardioides albus]MBB3088554.1 hypothetical protein [Nocardioides albus]GGU17108.1 hypothetical protein GCM10007979_14450 [Nocardioides albus]